MSIRMGEINLSLSLGLEGLWGSEYIDLSFLVFNTSWRYTGQLHAYAALSSMNEPQVAIR
jgi:hypothetical protein